MPDILYKCIECIWTGTKDEAGNDYFRLTCPDCTGELEPVFQTLENLSAKAERRRLDGIKPTRQQINKLYERTKKNM